MSVDTDVVPVVAAYARAPRGTSSGFVSVVLLTVYVLLAGMTPVAARDAMIEMPALTTGIMRFGIASLLILMTLKLRGERLIGGPVQVDPRDWPRIIAAAIVCVPANQACYLFGTKLSNATHSGLFYGLTPVVMYLSTVLLGTALWTTRGGVAATLAFVGAGAIAWEGYRSSFIDGRDVWFFVGDVLLLGAVTTWVAYTILSQPLLSKYGPLRTLSMILSIGTLIYLPALAIDIWRFNPAAISAKAWIGFAFITVLASYVNYILWFVLISRMDVNRMAITANASPIVAVIVAHFWHKDPITSMLLVGAACIFSAIALANWDRIIAVVSSRHRTA